MAEHAHTVAPVSERLNGPALAAILTQKVTGDWTCSLECQGQGSRAPSSIWVSRSIAHAFMCHRSKPRAKFGRHLGLGHGRVRTLPCPVLTALLFITRIHVAVVTDVRLEA